MITRTLRTLLAFVALTMLFAVAASAQTNEHRGGQSGSVTQNTLIKSTGPNRLASSRVTDDGATVSVAGPFARSTVSALTAGATVALDTTLGDIFTLTPGEDETINIAASKTGQRITLYITTSGTTSRTLTFGTRFKSTGTLATGTTNAKVFVIEFLCVDGTNYAEVSRTGAQ